MKTRMSLRFVGWLWVLVVSMFSAVSCTTPIDTAQEMTATQLRAHVDGPSGYGSTLFRGVSYAGSDINFDYIVLTSGDGAFTRYEMLKVHAGDFGITPRMPLQRDPSKWVDASIYFPFRQRPPAQRQN